MFLTVSMHEAQGYVKFQAKNMQDCQNIINVLTETVNKEIKWHTG